MNLGTSKDKVRVLLDTNILISALGFCGLPRKVLLLALEKKVQAVTSPILQAELREVISKKFPKLSPSLTAVEKIIKKSFRVVQPRMTVNVLRDTDDNRVLEAALEGKCSYIITGDKELLELALFENIEILTVNKFLEKSNL